MRQFGANYSSRLQSQMDRINLKDSDDDLSQDEFFKGHKGRDEVDKLHYSEFANDKNLYIGVKAKIDSNKPITETERVEIEWREHRAAHLKRKLQT